MNDWAQCRIDLTFQIETELKMKALTAHVPSLSTARKTPMH